MASKPLVTGANDIEDPKFSPDGKWVSFVRDANLYVVNAATAETRALTTGGSEEILKGQLDWVYPEELDVATAYWWSPDSSKIAYYEMDERPVTRYPIMDMSSPVGAMEYTRYPQAGEANPIVRVGVVPVEGGETKWMDTGADTDVYLARVVWLRDSRRVAIERLNRAQNRLDLLFCDAATGASATILTETDPVLDQHRRRSVFLLGQQALPVVERAHRLSTLLSLRSRRYAARSTDERRLADQRQRRLRPRRGQPSVRG